MEYKIRPVRDTDRQGVLNVFNYFVENGFAAYTEELEGPAYFDRLIRVSAGYPFYVVESEAGEIIGYALLHPYYALDAFRSAARITYFILPEYTRQGLGRKLLDMLIEDAGNMGIVSLLASISSRNEQSLNFHLKRGFVKCGEFKNVGCKWNQDFDEIWMQRFI